jgi:hypothetical protein
MGLTRDRGIWIGVAGLLGLYGVGLLVGLLVASAQGTHVDWTASPEIGAYVALATTAAIVSGVIVGPTKTPAVQSPLQLAAMPPPSPPEMRFTIDDRTYSAPLRPGELTSASAFGPDGELLGFMRSEHLPTSSEPPGTDTTNLPGSGTITTAAHAPAYTATWRHTTEGMAAVGAMNSLQKRLAHPSDGTRGAGMQPPTVKFGLRVATGPLGTDLSASELRAAFLRFLGRPPVRRLVSQITAIPNDVFWSSYDGNGRLMLGAILGDANDEGNVPIASALVNLCNNQISPFQDPRCSELVLAIEPRDAAGAPASPVTLAHWHDRLVTALAVPGAFVRFLSDEVSLQTHEAPLVELGVRLQARPNLGGLIDLGSSKYLAGTTATSDFPSYFIAEPGGRQPAQAAVDMLRTWCDHALHLDDYEEEFAGLG